MSDIISGIMKTKLIISSAKTSYNSLKGFFISANMSLRCSYMAVLMQKAFKSFFLATRHLLGGLSIAGMILCNIHLKQHETTKGRWMSQQCCYQAVNLIISLPFSDIKKNQ